MERGFGVPVAEGEGELRRRRRRRRRMHFRGVIGGWKAPQATNETPTDEGGRGGRRLKGFHLPLLFLFLFLLVSFLTLFTTAPKAAVTTMPR